MASAKRSASPSPHPEGKRAKCDGDDAPLLPNDALASIAVSGDASLFATMALCSRALHSQLRSPHFIALARERFLCEVWSDDRKERWHVNESGGKHGIEEGWNDAGMCTHRSYWRHNKLHGTSERWNDAGTLISLSHWCEGRPHGTSERWNDAGVHTYLSHWQDGKRHGSSEVCDNAGNRIVLLHWHEGKLHGTEEKWNDAGVRVYFAHWHKDNQHGTMERWNDAGERIHVSHWNHGIEVPGAP